MEARLRGTADDLQRIPGVGKSIAADLRRLGYTSVASLRGEHPQSMYDAMTRLDGVQHDRCLLYVFRCAVYFANTANPDEELLKWWSWSDENLLKRGTRSPRRKASSKA